ncbi:MAG: hypothetical protein FWE01_01740 [Firmicutes bacterium]|nr:hypothetical protein [Bacillota bacterium]
MKKYNVVPMIFAVVMMVCFVMGGVFLVVGDSVRASTEDGKDEEVAMSLFGVDGLVNGVIAATILNNIEDGYFARPFRIFPTVGEGFAHDLSETFFRVAFVDDVNRRIVMWAWDTYRDSLYHNTSSVTYSSSYVRNRILEDFGVIRSQVNGIDNYILQAGKVTAGALVSDRMWLASFDEVRSGGLWGLTPEMRSGNPNGFSAFSWLRSGPGAETGVITNTGGTTNIPIAGVVHSVRPAFYLCFDGLGSAAIGYESLSRTLFDEDGEIDEGKAAIIFSHVQNVDRGVPFRLFADVGVDENVLRLSRMYFRIVNVCEDSDRLTLWAVSGYRSGQFNSMAGNNTYDGSVVQMNLVEDFQKILDGFDVEDSIIMPAGLGQVGVDADDFIWLPSVGEVGSGIGLGEAAVGNWNLGAKHRSFDVAGLVHSWAWLRSAAGGLNVNSVDSGGGVASQGVTSTSMVVRPALHLRLSAFDVEEDDCDDEDCENGYTNGNGNGNNGNNGNDGYENGDKNGGRASVHPLVIVGYVFFGVAGVFVIVAVAIYVVRRKDVSMKRT